MDESMLRLKRFEGQRVVVELFPGGPTEKHPGLVRSVTEEDVIFEPDEGEVMHLNDDPSEGVAWQIRLEG